jgi:hypothetical protein
MIIKEKTLEKLGYSYEKARQLDKVAVQCNDCSTEYFKLKRDIPSWSHKCVKCFSKIQGKILGDTYGKAQTIQGSCTDCGTSIRSTAKRCKKCGPIFAKERMVGPKNPAWKGTSICSLCNKTKTNSAGFCRSCSIKSGSKSGSNNGRYVSDNRGYFLECNHVKKKLRTMLKNTTKKAGIVKGQNRTESMLGYSWKDFKESFESKFKEGMSWDNHGEWEIDHIIPIVWFIRNSVFEIKMVNALSNLQPLWAKDNLAKRDRVSDSDAWNFIAAYRKTNKII